MLIIELTYKKPLSEVDKFLEQHREFLQSCYDQGHFIASGVKEPRDGGVILAFCNEPKAREIIKNDPFFQQEIADYRFVFIEPSRYCKEFEPVFEKLKNHE